MWWPSGRKWESGTHNVSAEFAAKLKEWRGELTQKEAAQLLGVSIRTLQCWEQDQHAPGALAMAEIERRMKETKK